MAQDGIYCRMVEIQTKLSKDRETVDKLQEVSEITGLLAEDDEGSVDSGNTQAATSQPSRRRAGEGRLATKGGTS